MTVRRQLAVVVPLVRAGDRSLVLLMAPTLGSTAISLARVFDPSMPWADNVDAQIFFVARLPRVLAGALVGSTLAAAGVVLQALLRNPLATPFTLGVSASAALGAMLAIAFDLDVSLLRDAPPCRSPASPARSSARPWCISSRRASTGALDQRAAAGGRHVEHVFLCAHHVRAVPHRLRRLVSHGAMAARQSRRQQLQPDRGVAAARRRVVRCCLRCCRAR